MKTASIRTSTAESASDEALNKTLFKGLRLLEAVAEQQGRGTSLTELSSHLGWNVSTTHRLLSTLQERGYVERNPITQSYRLGIRTLELGASFLGGLDLRVEASPFLNELMLKTGLAVHLVILEEESGDVVYVDKVDSPQPVRMYTYIGIRFPANCTAAGKAILAYLAQEQVERFVARGLRSHTPNSITSPIRLLKELAQVRELGYALDREENAQAIHCVAAPIFNHTGKVAASVSLAGSVAQLPAEDLPDLGTLVKQAAVRISHSLGYRPAGAVQENQKRPGDLAS